jgi:molybdate transport system substrate-binding protein
MNCGGTMIRLLLVFTVLVTLAAPAMAGDIIVAAGAGLKDVLTDVATVYSQNNPSTKIVKNFVVSGTLAKQLDGGARMDVVFTANNEWMDYLQEKKHVEPGTIAAFAYNSLVFVGQGPRRAFGIQELASMGKIAVGSPKSVPAGEYAMEALRNAGIDKQMEGRLVQARDVRECLLYAERGEVDGAFVYKTDALQSKDAIVWFVVPQKLYSRVVYMSALTVSGAKNPEVVSFHAFLRSAETRVLLLKYGFEIQ